MLIYVSQGRDMTKVSKKKIQCEETWSGMSQSFTNSFSMLHSIHSSLGTHRSHSLVGSAKQYQGRMLIYVDCCGARFKVWETGRWGVTRCQHPSKKNSVGVTSFSHSEERRDEQKKESEGRKPDQELKTWLEVQAALREKIESLSWPEEGDYG